MFEIITVVNSVIIVAFLVAGGWVQLRNYFANKTAAKAAAAEAAIQARIDAAVTAARATTTQ